MDTYYIDGKFVDESEAKIDVNDLIVLRGYGVFDFLRTYQGRPFHLEDHVERLFESARLIGIESRWSKEEVISIVLEALNRSQHKECNIRLVISGGVSLDSITPEGKPKLMVMITATHQLPQEWFANGVKIVTSPTQRVFPEAKSMTYMPAILALKKARAQGAIESIYTDQKQRLLEGTTTNLYLVKGNQLITSSSDVLPGITRKVLLEILSSEFQIETRDVFKKELSEVEEVFISSSIKEVLPVNMVDDLRIGSGTVGPQAKRVMEIFRNYTDRYGSN